jgi:hypothetical protein
VGLVFPVDPIRLPRPTRFPDHTPIAAVRYMTSKPPPTLWLLWTGRVRSRAMSRDSIMRVIWNHLDQRGSMASQGSAAGVGAVTGRRVVGAGTGRL